MTFRPKPPQSRRDSRSRKSTIQGSGCLSGPVRCRDSRWTKRMCRARRGRRSSPNKAWRNCRPRHGFAQFVQGWRYRADARRRTTSCHAGSPEGESSHIGTSCGDHPVGVPTWPRRPCDRSSACRSPRCLSRWAARTACVKRRAAKSVRRETWPRPPPIAKRFCEWQKRCWSSKASPFVMWQVRPEKYWRKFKSWRRPAELFLRSDQFSLA